MSNCPIFDEYCLTSNLIGKTLYVTERRHWREWLISNHSKETEIWLIIPKKKSGKRRLPYADSVEEALCFGWIDSIVKKLDNHQNVQRFTPRRKDSSYSQTNKERLRLLIREGKVIPRILQETKYILEQEFVYPLDIIQALQEDEEIWDNFSRFSEPYKRIRVAYVNSSRKRPDEFSKRLSNLLKKTKKNKQFGYHIEKFY